LPSGSEKTVFALHPHLIAAPGDTTGRRFGMAFDLATTVVATLLDLSNGTQLAVESA
jgi:hypothetical protein